MTHMTNVANGNSLFTFTPFSEPGRGLSTVVRLIYNSREEHSDSPAGNNWSLSISGLSRFGDPIDIHPNNADSIAGRSNKFINLVDGTGRLLTFQGVTNPDGRKPFCGPRVHVGPQPRRRGLAWGSIRWRLAALRPCDRKLRGTLVLKGSSELSSGQMTAWHSLLFGRHGTISAGASGSSWPKYPPRLRAPRTYQDCWEASGGCQVSL